MSRLRPGPGLLVILLCVLTSVSTARAEIDLAVSNAWIREAPPGATVLAGYLKITNRGTTHATITGVSADDFSSVEVHRTVMEDGMARMLPVETIEIPAFGRLVLEPGGLHLMLIEPKRPLSEGDTVVLEMQPIDGPCITITVPVIRQTGSESHHHHHH